MENIGSRESIFESFFARFLRIPQTTMFSAEFGYSPAGGRDQIA